MTTYNVVSPGSLVSGQPEDISVILANLNAIAGVLNGNIDNANINVAAAIALAKLASVGTIGTGAVSIGVAGHGAITIADTGAQQSGITIGDTLLYRLSPQLLYVQNLESDSYTAHAAADADDAFGIYRAAEAQWRFVIHGNGKMEWGPGGATAPDVNLYRQSTTELRTDDTFSALGGLFARGAAGASIALGVWTSGDPNDRLEIRADGQIGWGGGTLAMDTNLYRKSAGELATDSRFTMLGSYFYSTSIIGIDRAPGQRVVEIYLTPDTDSKMEIWGDGKIQWGTGVAAKDTNLYRASADTLKTDDNFIANKLGVQLGTGNAIIVEADGRIYWGSAADVNLYRAAANVLGTDDSFQAVRVTATEATIGFLYQPVAGAGYALYSVLSGAANPLFAAQADGKLLWGPGGATAVDTNLYRSAALRLKTDVLFDATTLALATKAKAGTPADGDWAVAPPVGTLVVDTTANKIWARTGVATWKGVVIA